MAKLIALFCDYCTSVTYVPDLRPSVYVGCKWVSGCDEYENNIKSLCSCQAIFKRKLTAKKLERMIPVITEIYYSPGCKGATLAQRAFHKKLSGRRNIASRALQREDLKTE
jgi:hypothetical protein